MRRRLLLLLPPLAVAAAVGLLLLRSVGVKDRVPREASLRARSWNQPEWREVRKDLDRYVAEFGSDPDARWFAAETYARIWAAPQAFDVVWDDPGLADDPATPHRFASLMLTTLGGSLDRGTTLYWRCLLSRIEGHDAEARDELIRVARSITPQVAAGAYLPAHRVPSEGLRVLAAAFDARTDDKAFAVASATLGICPGERAKVDLLLPMIESWPYNEIGMWTQAVRSVSASGDPRVIEALRKAQRNVKESDPIAGERRWVLEMGLALAEDPESIEKVLARARSDAPNPVQSRIYAEGLSFRLACGEPKAVGRVVALWTGPVSLETRLQLAAGCLLPDPGPPAELPADAWVRDLVASDVPIAKALAHAYQWRVRGADEAVLKKALVEDLREAVRQAWKQESPIDGEGPFSSTVIEVLRAWYRWPRPKS